MKKLNIIYQEKTNGIRIRSKCGWYEHREKSAKFFQNLEINLEQFKIKFETC